MIFIVVKFPVKPEYAEEWPEITRSFTEATRAEPGNKWFEWSRSLEDPNEYVLVEAFDDEGAEPHVNSAHFRAATADDGPMHRALAATPKIISRQIDGDGWDAMGEMTVS
ncbi:putative quinol monooxygenase [Nesterenkonia aerolata]|uniref:Quinol monooxygenase n=1 Tax=Nesterenkonia aerolata TaxID=3074079 RepID=A0ABU2DTX3_9MICC|nr:putative quinol monooxygenase [Nesterenkonia sp. LY-0111]MDR8019957.1 putative quinol monooxygenase [Nesterenkonia sp. LY-0111]